MGVEADCFALPARHVWASFQRSTLLSTLTRSSSTRAALQLGLWERIAHSLSFQDVGSLELTCRTFREAVANSRILQITSFAHIDGLQQMTVDAERFSRDCRLPLSGFSSARLNMAVLKRLYCLLCFKPVQKRSLIWRVVYASSTAHARDKNWLLYKFNHIYNLAYHSVYRGFGWSSTHREGSEEILLQLTHPLILIHKIYLRMFVDKASRNKKPGQTYVRFCTGCQPTLTDQDYWHMDVDSLQRKYNHFCGTGEWTHTSRWFLCSDEDDADQEFLLPPTICHGGLLKVELIREADTPSNRAWTINIGYCKVLGKPAWGMQLAAGQVLQPIDYPKDSPKVFDGFHSGKVDQQAFMAMYSHQQFAATVDVPFDSSASEEFSDDGVEYDV